MWKINIRGDVNAYNRVLNESDINFSDKKQDNSMDVMIKKMKENNVPQTYGVDKGGLKDDFNSNGNV